MTVQLSGANLHFAVSEGTDGSKKDLIAAEVVVDRGEKKAAMRITMENGELSIELEGDHASSRRSLSFEELAKYANFQKHLHGESYETMQYDMRILEAENVRLRTNIRAIEEEASYYRNQSTGESSTDIVEEEFETRF